LTKMALNPQQPSQDAAENDLLANLPKNPPIYQGSGFDPSPLEAAVELSRKWRLSQLRDLLGKEKEGQTDLSNSKREEVKKARAHQPELRKMEKEARNQLEKARGEANQSVDHFKHGLKDSGLKEFTVLKARMKERMEEEKQKLTAGQETIHSETLAMESKLKHEVDMKVVKMSTEGAIKAERENHAQRLDMLKHQASERRETALQSIKLAATTLGAGLSDFLGGDSNDRRMALALTLSTAVLGIYTAKVGTGVAARFVEARLGKPSLVRETSRDAGIAAMATNPVRRALGTVGLPAWAGGIAPSSGDPLKGVILNPSVEERLRSVASSTKNTKRNRAPFRHLLLYGPPGTGKTLFAKGLAKHSGLEYAILTGGDVAPLGRDAVTEIHKVFEWAETSSKGVLLFIDESDAFLRRRATETMSEDLRNALNAFLYRTGGASDKFMVVYASNQPEQFDWAINDRIDEMVEFQLPSSSERLRMVAHYMHTLLVAPPKDSQPVTVAADVDADLVAEVVAEIQGFSGREIAKLAVAWQAAAYGRTDATLDKALLKEVLAVQLAQKALKMIWAAEENKNYAVITDSGPTAPAPPTLHQLTK